VSAANPSDDQPRDVNKDALVEFINDQRRHVLGILEGLSEEPAAPISRAIGMESPRKVKHLAVDVEHYWFRCIIGGESLGFFAKHGYDNTGSWRVEKTESADDVFSLYRDEIIEGNAMTGGRLGRAYLPIRAAPRDL
jgi:hypothetical protein